MVPQGSKKKSQPVKDKDEKVTLECEKFVKDQIFWDGHKKYETIAKDFWRY